MFTASQKPCGELRPLTRRKSPSDWIQGGPAAYKNRRSARIAAGMRDAQIKKYG
jgi:hypothetical protein